MEQELNFVEEADISKIRREINEIQDLVKEKHVGVVWEAKKRVEDIRSEVGKLGTRHPGAGRFCAKALEILREIEQQIERIGSSYPVGSSEEASTKPFIGKGKFWGPSQGNSVDLFEDWRNPRVRSPEGRLRDAEVDEVEDEKESCGSVCDKFVEDLEDSANRRRRIVAPSKLTPPTLRVDQVEDLGGQRTTKAAVDTGSKAIDSQKMENLANEFSQLEGPSWWASVNSREATFKWPPVSPISNPFEEAAAGRDVEKVPQLISSTINEDSLSQGAGVKQEASKAAKRVHWEGHLFQPPSYLVPEGEHPPGSVVGKSFKDPYRGRGKPPSSTLVEDWYPGADHGEMSRDLLERRPRSQILTEQRFSQDFSLGKSQSLRDFMDRSCRNATYANSSLGTWDCSYPERETPERSWMTRRTVSEEEEDRRFTLGLARQTWSCQDLTRDGTPAGSRRSGIDNSILNSTQSREKSPGNYWRDDPPLHRWDGNQSSSWRSTRPSSGVWENDWSQDMRRPPYPPPYGSWEELRPPRRSVEDRWSSQQHGPRTPIWKWTIPKFDGKEESLPRFLTLLQHYAQAEGATAEDLFRGRIYLFTGDAADFVATNPNIRCWEELVEELRQYVLGSSSDYDRVRTIERKKQGMESCNVYITKMDLLFRNMRSPPTEVQKVHIILRGMKVHIRQALAGNTSLRTLADLRAAAQQVETISFGIREMHALDVDPIEPESGGQRNKRSPQEKSKVPPRSGVGIAAGTVASKAKRIVCFRCREVGHYRSECSNPPKVQCYGCGQDGVLIKDCPACQGN